MHRFNRIHGNGIPKPEDQKRWDVCLNDDKMLFKVEHGQWVCKGPQARPQSKLIDCSGPPTCELGKLGDIAVTPSGQMYVHNDVWEDPIDLADQASEVFVTNDLIVRGNIQLPIYEGHILLRNLNGEIVAAIPVVPWPVVPEE